VNDGLELIVTGQHCDLSTAELMDAVPATRIRSLPRHRARRPRWKPDLEPVQPRHAQDRDALVG
jgi:hypothetical protein